MARKLASNLINIPTVSSLPTVTEATEVYFQNAAMATNGWRWHLIYNPASASTYKWEYVGGSPMINTVQLGSLAISAAAATWQSISAIGSWTLPYAGDYIFRWGTNVLVNANQVLLQTGPLFGGAVWPGGSARFTTETAGGGLADYCAIYREELGSAVPANTVVTFGAWRGSTAAWTIYLPTMSIQPVRIG